MLGAELTEHLGYKPHGEPTSEQTNRRNGATRKVLKGNDGAVPIEIPRDRPLIETSFRLPGRRLHGNLRRGWLYAAGLLTRDIRAHLEEVYGLNVSADLISRVTDAVLAEVSDWQNRAMEPMFPVHCRAMDGLKGFPDAINAAFPETTVQAGAPPVQG
jgi:transposase-like protein